MAPLVGVLLKLLIPVVVGEVQRKIADDHPVKYEIPSDVPASEYVVPAVKAAVVGNLKSKTSWVSLALVVLGALEMNQQLVTDLVGTSNVGLVVGVIGILSLYLRNLTTTSVVEKSE